MKKVVFTFGRMNPPTIGHEKLVNKLKAIASKEKADARLYLSHTNKPGSDPLSYKDKLKFAQKAFGIAYKSNAKQIIQIAKELQGQGYTDIVMVVGSDRVSEFSTLLKKYNGKGDYDFKSIKVVSAGQRDPDATGVEGMSGTKLRDLVKSGDPKTFMSGLASSLSNVDRKKIYALVKKNMNEAVEIDEKPLTPQQRIARGRQMKRLAPKLARAREKKKKRMADPKALKKRAQKAAMIAVRKKVAGEKGEKYDKLSPADKMNVDKLVQKKAALIAKLSKKLLPIVRKKEQARLASLKKEDVDYNQMVEALLQEASRADRMKIQIDKEKEDDVKDNEREKEQEKDRADAEKEKELQNKERERDQETVQNKRKKIADRIRHKGIMNRARQSDAKEKEREKNEEYNLPEDVEISLRKKANKSGISYDIIKEIYDRGMKSWSEDSHSELTQQQWAYARVNSFITGGKTIIKDADLWKTSINEQFEKVLDERNYRKEYDNYHSRPEQIARRSSRNQARRIMGDKTVVGQDVGHKDNNPLNNSPNNLRNEDPTDNRKEPRLRFNELAWYTKAKHKLDQVTHPKEFEKLVSTYVELMKQSKYKGKNSKAAADIALQTKSVDSRELIDYINKLVSKGILPKQLKAEYYKEDMQTEEGGAGEFGTTEATKRYKMDTPGEDYNPDDDFDVPIKSKKKKAGK